MSIYRELYMCKLGFDLTDTGKSDKASFLKVRIDRDDRKA